MWHGGHLLPIYYNNNMKKALLTLAALVGLTTVVNGETKYVSVMSGVT